MADIFRSTNRKREEDAGLEPTPAAPAAPAPGQPAISFTGKAAPLDPAKEAARTAAKLRLLRQQDSSV